MRFIILTVLFAVAAVSPPAAADEVTGAFNPETGEFGGVVRQVGCRTNDALQISGQVKDGRVTGADNVSAFDMPIESDGSFGPQKDFLRKHSSGDDKFRWISGRLDGERLIIDVEYGSPGHGASFCGSKGNIFEAGAECPLCGLGTAANPDSAKGLDIDKTAADLIAEWGKYAATEAGTKAIYSEEAGDLESKAFWLKVRARVEKLQN